MRAIIGQTSRHLAHNTSSPAAKVRQGDRTPYGGKWWRVTVEDVLRWKEQLERLLEGRPVERLQAGLPVHCSHCLMPVTKDEAGHVSDYVIYCKPCMDRFAENRLLSERADR